MSCIKDHDKIETPFCPYCGKATVPDNLSTLVEYMNRMLDKSKKELARMKKTQTDHTRHNEGVVKAERKLDRWTGWHDLVMKMCEDRNRLLKGVMWATR